MIGALSRVPCGIFLKLVAINAIFTVSIFIAPAALAALFMAKVLGFVIAGVARVGGNFRAGANVVATLGRGHRAGFRGRGADIGGKGLLLVLTQGGQVVGDNFFFVEPDLRA